LTVFVPPFHSSRFPSRGRPAPLLGQSRPTERSWCPTREVTYYTNVMSTPPSLILFLVLVERFIFHTC
jgi:hypothetical protein